MRGKACILILVAMLVSWKSWSQYNSLNNKFTVNEVKGCTGLNIQVTHNVTPACGTGGIFCVIRYGDGRPAQPFVSGDIANYPTAGNFKLKIIYSTTLVDNDSIDVSITANDPPAFEPYSCNGNQVSVKVTESKYAYYIFNYNDATAEITKPANAATDIHTYAAPPPSTRNVSVRGYNGPGTADNCVSNTLPVTVAPTLPAATISQVEVLDASSVKVDFASSPSIQYRFMIATNNAASFQQYKQIYSPAAATLTETIPNIRPDDNYYCFRVDTFNPCGNNVAASSSIVCSTNFDVATQNNQNNLTWNTANASGAHPLANFTVVKNNTALTPTLAANQRAYSDTDVVCGTSYTYRLESNYPGNAKSLSLPKTVTAFSSDIPAAIENISAVVNPAGTEVQLSWVQDPAYNASEYTILKSSNGGFTPRGTSDQTTFTDTEYTTASAACYKIEYIDACNNRSPQSREACPVALTGNVQGNNVITINWTPYNGWAGGTKNYVIERYDRDGNLIGAPIDRGTSTTYTDTDMDNQVYLYIIYAYANDGALEHSSSNKLELIKQPNIYYPTAFTPDHQGPVENETFRVFGQYVTKFEMQIFNRWGEMMYVTDDIEKGWDGTFRGKEMPEGTYAFKAKLTDNLDRTFERSGSFFLIRK